MSPERAIGLAILLLVFLVLLAALTGNLGAFD